MIFSSKTNYKTVINRKTPPCAIEQSIINLILEHSNNLINDSVHEATINKKIFLKIWRQNNTPRIVLISGLKTPVFRFPLDKDISNEEKTILKELIEELKK